MTDHNAPDDPSYPYEDDPAYLAHLEAMEKECHASYTTSGSDPYGSNCDLEAGHYPATDHSGPNPFAPGRVTWRGGGSCAGDPLPTTKVQFTYDDPKAEVGGEEDADPEALGPCGCHDYHMADCHLSASSPPLADYPDPYGL